MYSRVTALATTVVAHSQSVARRILKAVQFLLGVGRRLRTVILDIGYACTTTQYIHTSNSPLSGTTQVSQYQKGKNQSGFY